MLGKKCPQCRRKIKREYDFCPYCGFSLKQGRSEDWGILGKDDFFTENFAGFGGNFFGLNLSKMFNNAMKMLEKEMKREMSMNPGNCNASPFKSNLQIYINGRKIDLNKKSPLKQKKSSSVNRKINLPKFSKQKSKEFSKLPKKEPETTIRRLSDKIIYEINLPGVKSGKDISIEKFEKSIEIKAVSEKASYHKIIKIDLPVIKYKLLKGILILELGIK